jgi:hypothetical protein
VIGPVPPIPAADSDLAPADTEDAFSLDDDTPLACPVGKVDGQPCESCQ